MGKGYNDEVCFMSTHHYLSWLCWEVLALVGSIWFGLGIFV
jgi:hypothetical protein